MTGQFMGDKSRRFVMEYTAFRAEEYDAKIRQTLPFYEEFYEQVIELLFIFSICRIIGMKV